MSRRFNYIRQLELQFSRFTVASHVWSTVNTNIICVSGKNARVAICRNLSGFFFYPVNGGTKLKHSKVKLLIVNLFAWILLRIDSKSQGLSNDWSKCMKTFYLAGQGNQAITQIQTYDSLTMQLIYAVQSSTLPQYTCLVYHLSTQLWLLFVGN